MNPKQRLILRKLVAFNGQKYSELLKFFSPDDKFPYHLKLLLTKNLITKEKDKYYITKDGMTATGNFDTHSLEEIASPKPLILYILKNQGKYFLNNHYGENKNDKRQIYFFPFAIPRVGITLRQSAHEEFLRKYRIDQDFKFRTTYHVINRTTAGDLLFDTIWLVFQAQSNKLHRTDTPTKGEEWFSKEEISKLKSIHPTIKRLIVDSVKSKFIEETVILDYGLEKSDLPISV